MIKSIPSSLAIMEGLAVWAGKNAIYCFLPFQNQVRIFHARKRPPNCKLSTICQHKKAACRNQKMRRFSNILFLPSWSLANIVLIHCGILSNSIPWCFGWKSLKTSFTSHQFHISLTLSMPLFHTELFTEFT